MVIVAKFGGTSGKDGSTLEGVIENIVKENPERRVLVFSAPGKRNQQDIKVTDLLSDIAQDTYGKFNTLPVKLNRLRKRFERDFLDYFRIEHNFLDPIFSELSDLLRIQDPNESRYMDRILPQGERIYVRIVEEVMKRKGINAKAYFPEEIGLITNGIHGGAKVDERSYRKISARLRNILKNSDQVVLIPGFYGLSGNDEITTFSRGGSDLTGAIIARALSANLYENFTDTDGVYRVPPIDGITPETIPNLTYREARELRLQVLHMDTMLPLLEKGIPMRVRSTFEPEKVGTLILQEREDNGYPIEGISYISNSLLFTIKRDGMDDITGYKGRTMQIISDQGISVTNDTSDTDAMTFIIAEPQYNGRNKNSQKQEFYRKMKELKKSLEKDRFLRPDKVELERDVALMYVVGRNMRNSPDIAGKLFTAIGNAGVGIKYISQGLPSQIAISFGIDNVDINKAVYAIHQAFFNKNNI